MSDHIVFGDWRDLRAAIGRAAPDWAGDSAEKRQMLWDFAVGVIAEYAPMKAQCLSCRAVISVREAYRCADCHAHLCGQCIRPHFEGARHPTPKEPRA